MIAASAPSTLNEQEDWNIMKNGFGPKDPKDDSDPT